MAKKGGARPGAGRPKGSLNKLNATIKEMLLEAFDDIGGKKFLIKVAHEDPKTFCNLIGKLIPNEIAGSVDLKHTMSEMTDDDLEFRLAELKRKPK